MFVKPNVEKLRKNHAKMKQLFMDVMFFFASYKKKYIP